MHFPTWDENGKMAEGADPLDFVSGDDRIRVYFDIVVKEPEKETPSTSAPSNRSSGSYSAPSSGYDNSGSYSVPSSGNSSSDGWFDNGDTVGNSSKPQGESNVPSNNGERGFDDSSADDNSSTGREADDFLAIIP